MSYRFQRITSLYDVFVRQFLTINQDYRRLSHDELYERLIKTRFSESDYYSTYMKKLGNEAEDVFCSFEPLQKLWAKEHKIKFGKNNWQKDIIYARIKEFHPHILYIENFNVLDKKFRERLRKLCDNNLLILSWVASPITDYKEYNDFDLILSSAPHFVQNFRSIGVKSIYMPAAFEHTLLNSIPSGNRRDLNFTFTGAVGDRYGHHTQRYNLIKELLATTPLEIWGNCNNNNRNILQIVKCAMRFKPISRIDKICSGRFHEPVFGVDYYKILSRSKITFNSHIDVAGNYAGNMRLYEATGMGACLLTDSKSNLSDLFEPEMEVVTYSNAKECKEKIDYLLENDDEREKIAARGQKRTLRDYTYVTQINKLDHIIKEILE